MSKRKYSFCLAVLMLFALSAGFVFNVSAYAEEAFIEQDYEEIGLKFQVPESFQNTVGVFDVFPYSIIDDGIYCKSFFYFAMTPEDVNTSLSWKEVKTPDEITAIRDAGSIMLSVMAIDGSRSAEDILAAFEADGEEYSVNNFTEIGKVDDLTFYLFESPERTEAWLSEIEPEFADEFTSIHDELIEMLKNAEFYVPVVWDDYPVGQALRFKTEDTDGNPVKSEELFGQHEITMVNTWDTGCDPCIGELEGLNEMNQRLAEKDAAVIGICTDADARLDQCKALLDEHHVDYPNLLPFRGMYESLDISMAPTSFFIGRNGRILYYPYIGAPADLTQYEVLFDYLLVMNQFMDPFCQNQRSAVT